MARNKSKWYENNRDKTKVGILTFHWADDFGAMLQSYALMKYIQNHFEDTRVRIIPYADIHLVGRYWIYPYIPGKDRDCSFFSRRYFGMYKHNVRHMVRYLIKRYRMRCFRRRDLDCSHYTANRVGLHLDEYDLILVGSDQVWNPEITQGFDLMYLGEFEKKKETALASYAASIGRETLSEEEGRYLGKMLDEHFDFVSVREPSSIEFLSQFTGKEIVSMPDPTLLLTAKIWSGVAKKPACKGYVLCYYTEKNEEMFDFVKRLAANKGLKSIMINSLAIGPAEFLGYIEAASYVVTNSFHGTVFAILFHRKMLVYAHSNKNARISDLVTQCGMEQRLGITHIQEEADEYIDWQRAEEGIKELRIQAENYLGGLL